MNERKSLVAINRKNHFSYQVCRKLTNKNSEAQQFFYKNDSFPSRNLFGEIFNRSKRKNDEGDEKDP
jgi:hypothetical protein